MYDALVRLKETVKSRLGDLWWYSLVFFVFLRLGDLINTYIGLWVVPKYVPHHELGALLPLLYFSTVLVFPISVLSTTFSKYINVFATRNEVGKVKSFLRDVFCLSLVLCLITVVCAYFFMPFVLERMRVANGRLGILIVFSGMIGAISTFFYSALQALKLFRWHAIIAFLCAPIRLFTLLIFLPIRPLSGYFMGQIVPVLFGMGAAVIALRRFLFSKIIKPEPYLATDGRYIFRFAFFIFMGGLLTLPQIIVEPFVIRHRLPELDSAAYYMISRFAEIGSSVGVTMAVILFPLASEQHERGQKTQRLVLQAASTSLLFGIILSILYYFGGAFLLRLVPNGCDYIIYIPHLTLLTIIVALRSCTTIFVAHETAHLRFGIYWWSGVLIALESVFLYAITGYSFFIPWIPISWIQWIETLNPYRLSFILWIMFLYSLIWVLCMSVHLLIHRRNRKATQPRSQNVTTA